MSSMRDAATLRPLHSINHQQVEADGSEPFTGPAHFVDKKPDKQIV